MNFKKCKSKVWAYFLIFTLLFSNLYSFTHITKVNAADTHNFIHPGILFNQEDLDRMKNDKGTETLSAAYTYFSSLASAQSTYVMKGPFAVVTRDPSGGGTGNRELEQDGVAAFHNALMWYITGNTANRDKAIEILNAWSYTLTEINGIDAQLASGDNGKYFANAGEILRYSNSGWAEADAVQLEKVFKDVFYPKVQVIGDANWGGSCMKTIISMAVFRNDSEMFNYAIYNFQNNDNGAKLTENIDTDVNFLGQCSESGRDQTHALGNIGNLSEVAEVAWKQGIDLYSLNNNLLLSGFEYWCKYNLGNTVPYDPNFHRRTMGPWSTISATYRSNSIPWAPVERIYNHYVIRQGLPESSVTFTKQYRDGLVPNENKLFSRETSNVTLAPKVDKITVVNNNTGTSDTVEVIGLNEGSVIKVYDAQYGGNKLGETTVTNTNSIVTIPQIGVKASSIYVTVTEVGKQESERAIKAFDTQADYTYPPTVDQITVVNNNTDIDDTVSVTGLPVGSIIKVYDAATGGNILGETTVTDTSSVVTIPQIGVKASYVYITVTEAGKLESDRVAKQFDVQTDFTDAPTVEQIKVINNTEGTEDIVKVNGLPIDSVIKVYDAATGDNKLGEANVTATSSAITIPQIGVTSSAIYVTATEPGKLESDRTAKLFVGEDGIVSLKLEAEKSDALSSSIKVTNSTTESTGSSVGIIENVKKNYYSVFNNITLDGMNEFKVRYAGKNLNASYVEIRLDSNTGTLIGKCDLPGTSTSTWNVYNTASINIDTTTGTHNIYLVYGTSGTYVGNFDWFQFSKTAADMTSLDATIANAQALQQSEYTEASWSVMQNALSNANVVSNNPLSTQEQVDAAKNVLSTVISELKVKPELEFERVLPAADAIKLGDPAKVRIKVTNNGKASKNVALIVALFDDNNHMVVYGASQSSIEASKQTELEVMMNIPSSGSYTVKYFVWDSLNTQQAIEGVDPGVIPVN